MLGDYLVLKEEPSYLGLQKNWNKKYQFKLYFENKSLKIINFAFNDLVMKTL
jgi:hypothetical protein